MSKKYEQNLKTKVMNITFNQICKTVTKQERLGRISSGHIFPFVDSQDIISFHCDLRYHTVCKFIMNRMILLYQDYFD